MTDDALAALDARLTEYAPLARRAYQNGRDLAYLPD